MRFLRTFVVTPAATWRIVDPKPEPDVLGIASMPPTQPSRLAEVLAQIGTAIPLDTESFLGNAHGAADAKEIESRAQSLRAEGTQKG
ncbi:MAG: hypothetical protein GEU99_20450 [Luteitalea sp.]|nr:hypothetical protein [Luteitalea sp.]